MCDADRSFCVECLADDDCSSGECDVEANVCLGCGADADCDDRNPCTVDRCNDRVCTSEPSADGTPCDDGDPCTADDLCGSGTCFPGGAVDALCELVCDSKTPCPGGYVCRYASGSCTGQGACEPMPVVECGKVIDPVCGCDGTGYDNPCRALSAGVDFAEGGECGCAAEPVVCEAPLVPTDLDQDGCDDVCACPPAPECPGSQPKDANQDGCAETCACKWDSLDSDCPSEGQVCRVESCDQVGVCGAPVTDCGSDSPPVCGCDGVTYPNACDAEAKGMSVAASGACCVVPSCAGGEAIDTDADGCPDTCPCVDSSQCATDQRCAVATCGDVGVCAACSDTTDAVPVCGCDGVTWPSACEAPSGVKHEGACCEDLVCAAGKAIDTDNDGCADECACGSVDGQPVACGADEVCAPKGCGGTVSVCFPCLDDTGPVCGCDGKTWPSACKAFSSGVGVQHAGACKCGLDAPCADETQYCDVKTCEPNSTGTCQPCSTNNVKACGCDGTVYANSCELAKSGVALKTIGACPTICTSVTCAADQVAKDTNDDGCADTCVCNPVTCDSWEDDSALSASGCSECAPKSCETTAECNADAALTKAFCKRDAGKCNGLGQCEPVEAFACPTDGTADASTVCGCDGKTYATECEAYAGGSSVESLGACPCPTVPFECQPGFELSDTDQDGCEDKCVAKACETNGGCGANTDSWCQKPVGACDAAGKCALTPGECSNDGAADTPVCGCDGKTYPSECVASAAGVSVAKAVACEVAGTD